MFIAVLFTTAKTWKPPKCAPRDAWIKKICYIYTVEYYSILKKKNNTIGSNIDATRDYPSKSEKDKYHMISLICGT